jgi:uncharacterized C2H2 Zn-finger protein
VVGEEKKMSNTDTSIKEDLTTLASDFQCFVCGEIFTTDEDRKQHLEKEAHRELHEGTTQKEMKIAKEQEDINEDHFHHI